MLTPIARETRYSTLKRTDRLPASMKESKAGETPAIFANSACDNSDFLNQYLRLEDNDLTMTSRKRGPVQPLTREWKLRALGELNARKMRQKDLAKMIDCTQGAVSRVLDVDSKVSKNSDVARQIGEILGIPIDEPAPKAVEETRELLDGLRKLKDTDPSQYDYLMGMLHDLLRRSQ